MSSVDHSSSRELYFLYELARAFASSIDLAEVTENVIDGTCAFLGAEQGFLYFLADDGTLQHHASRGLGPDDLRVLAEYLAPVLAERQAVTGAHPSSSEGEVLAVPLIAHNEVRGAVGIATSYARSFTPQEQERLLSLSNLASLALENARLHEKVQRELDMLMRLIRAAQLMEAGKLTKEQATEFEKVRGWDEISRLSQVFGRMAQEVMRREEDLRRQVQELRIEIDETKRARQVAEITETDYFQELRRKAREIRAQTERAPE
jgi:GAF domain-containing protein